MEKKTKVVSNWRQLARLVELMLERQANRTDFCERAIGWSGWEVIATELNSLGPPQRSYKKWVRVWTDLKCKTRKKMCENQIEYVEGGSNKLHKFTPIEEMVANYLGKQNTVALPDRKFGVGCPINVNTADTGEDEAVETDPFYENFETATEVYSNDATIEKGKRINNNLNKSNVVSNRRQLARLVELMQERQGNRTNFCDRTIGRSGWEVIAAELNSLGPPQRSCGNWVKVWTDLKLKTRKKICENQIEHCDSDGGSNKLHILTPIEAMVANYLGNNNRVALPGRKFGVGCPTNANTEDTGEDDAVETDPLYENFQTTTEVYSNDATIKKEKRVNKNLNKRFKLLETQLNCQKRHTEVIKESLDEIKKELKTLKCYARKSFILKQEILILKKEKLKIEKEKLRMYKEKLKQKNVIIDQMA